MEKLSQAKQRVLNAFEARTDDWTYTMFERELKESMGKHYINYQDAKLTITDAHKTGEWPKTVKRYILTNYKLHGNSSHPLIIKDILNGLSEKEKTDFDIQK